MDQTNAKASWMKVVDKHNKKQKGLPALSTLNTDAGDVETGIQFFNSSTMSEDYQKKPWEETIELYYPELTFEIYVGGNPNGYYNTHLGGWLPDDPEEVTITTDWTYSVLKDSVIDFLRDEESVQEEFDFENLSDEEYIKAIEDNLDDLVLEYEDKLLDNFYDDAIAYSIRNMCIDNRSGKNKVKVNMTLRVNMT